MAQGIEVNVHPSERLIALSLAGVLTKAFLWEVMAELSATEGADPNFNLLFDGTELEIGSDLDISDLARFEAEIPTHREKLAIVARGDHNFGIGNMYQRLCGDENPREIQVFRDAGEARRWLT